VSTAHQEYQRTYYDRTYPSRMEAVRDQLAHPLFCSFQDRLADRILDLVAPEPSTSAADPASNRSGAVPLRVFETACGEGFLGAALRRMAKRRGINVHYAGTDLSEGALGLARQSVGGDLVVGDAVEVTADMPAGSADVVIIKNLLHHLEDPAGLLREAGRVVSPSGHVVVVEARLGAPPVTMLAMMAPRREKFFWVGSRRNRKAVDAAGLTIEHAERFSFLPYELFFQIRYPVMRRVFSTSNPRTIQRIADLDVRLTERIPALAGYWIWVAAPAAVSESGASGDTGRRSST
jgi:SAM-dependent methyltransferase